MANTQPIRLVVSGCCGRMGSLIVEEATKDPAHFELAGGLEGEGHPKVGQPLAGNPKVKISTDLKNLLERADLLIEFTAPEASLSHALIAAESKVRMIIGTTGFSTEQFQQLKDLAQRIPIFWSPNMSTGVFIVRKTIRSIFEILKGYGLDDTAQVKISETHHTQKKDAPSGTAKQLAEDVRKASGKPPQEIPIDWKREGNVVGLHTVTFDLGPEQIVLKHEATDRRVFAMGTLLVAKYFPAFGRQAGWYGMDDLMAISYRE